MVLVYEEEDLGVMTEAEAKKRDNRKSFQVSSLSICINNVTVKIFYLTGKSDERRIGIGTRR